MNVTVQIIKDEIDLRIEKLKGFEDNARVKNENELAHVLQIRRLEYENFKSWIERGDRNVI